MKLREMFPETKMATVNFGAVDLQIVYRPAALTSVGNAMDSDDDDEDEVRNPLADRISDIVVSWDLEGPLPVTAAGGKEAGSVVADGEPVPIDPAAIQYIPIHVLSTILVALNQDAMPDPKEMRKRSRKRG